VQFWNWKGKQVPPEEKRALSRGSVVFSEIRGWEKRSQENLKCRIWRKKKDGHSFLYSRGEKKKRSSKLWCVLGERGSALNHNTGVVPIVIEMLAKTLRKKERERKKKNYTLHYVPLREKSSAAYPSWERRSSPRLCSTLTKGDHRAGRGKKGLPAFAKKPSVVKLAFQKKKDNRDSRQRGRRRKRATASFGGRKGKTRGGWAQWASRPPAAA